MGQHAALVRVGLLSDFLGAVIVGFSGFFGVTGGFGGVMVWVNIHWRTLWWVGWALLALGFMFQLVASIMPGRAKDTDQTPSSLISQKVVLWILVLLLLFFAVITYFQYMRGTGWVNLLSLVSVYLGILGIGFSYWLSLTTITRIDKSLYPDAFEVQVVGSMYVKPHAKIIHPVKIREKSIKFKNVGFRLSVRNTSKQYPASNVFLTVHFEKNRFLVDGKEISDDSDNVTISEKLQEYYRNYQCMTVDKLPISGDGNSSGHKDLIGVGIIIPNIPPRVTVHFFIPMQIELIANTGMVVIEASKKRCMFNYELAENNKDKLPDTISFGIESTGVSLNPGSISESYSGATPAIQIRSSALKSTESDKEKKGS